VSEIEIREATTGDLDQILDVLALALGETSLLKRTPDLWRWKHELNPHGHSIVLVATSAGRVVGVRAFMKWALQTVDGVSLSCVRPVDTATHPEFSRRGIFRDLTMSAIEIARATGVDLVFNTPNEKSAPGYLNMGWREVGTIGVLARIKPFQMRRARSSSVPSLSTAIPLARPYEDTKPNPVAREPRGLRTRRDQVYLKWRFTMHPTARYGWVSEGNDSGLVCRGGLRRGRTELVVSDLLGVPAASIVRASSRSTTCAYMAGWFSKGTPERAAAMSGGMAPLPGVKTLRLVALPLTDMPVNVHELANWDFATSDMELL